MKNNTSCIFCLKPYVKNGIFEKKNYSSKTCFFKKEIN